MRAIRRFTVRVTLPEPLAALLGLMLNLRWSWHGPTADLFASIDPAAWEASGGEPIAMLSALPPARIAALAADEEFLGRLGEAERDLRQYMSDPRWYAAAGPDGPSGHAESGPAAVAYGARQRRGAVEATKTKVAVVTHGDTGSFWSVFKKGVDQAHSDLGSRGVSATTSCHPPALESART